MGMRIFRIVRFLKKLYLLAFGFIEAVQAIFWVTILMLVILYCCAICLVKTVGHPPAEDPNKLFLEYHFSTIITSMLTLFVLMSSPDLPDYLAEPGLLAGRPIFGCFLIGFIVVGSFGMIALLTGVISESMFEKNNLRIEQSR